MKNYNYGGLLKNPIFKGWFMKTQYIVKNRLKRKALGNLLFNQGLCKKEGGRDFEGGRVDTPMHTT